MEQDFATSRVLLAHELGNLTDANVIYDAPGNTEANANSIMHVMQMIGELEEKPPSRVRYVSPYLFLAEYRDREATCRSTRPPSF